MFFFEQMLAKVQTSLPVRVVAVTNSGGVSPTGFVDVVPMVTQTDANGMAVPHTTIFNLPYCRVQGGTNAVIIDPQVGDIGVAVFASRDISKVKYTGKENPPGSDRRYSFSDGMYLFGIITTAPTQYIQFSAGGITIHSNASVRVEAPQANIVATTSATVTAPSVELGASGGTLRALIDERFNALFNSHTHPIPSGGNTGTPNQTAGAGQLTSATKAN